MATFFDAMMKPLKATVLAVALGLLAFVGVGHAVEKQALTKDHDLCQVKTYAGLSLEDFKEKLDTIDDIHAPNCRRDETIMFKAAPYASGELIQFLLDAGADPNVIASDKCTAICRAAMWNNIDTLNLVLMKGSDLKIGKDIHGKILDRILLYSPKEAAETIAQYVAINHENIDLNTWKVAIKRTDSVVIKSLLEHHIPSDEKFYPFPFEFNSIK